MVLGMLPITTLKHIGVSASTANHQPLGGMLTSELPKASLQGCSEAPSISAPQANLRDLRCEDAGAFFRPLSRFLLWNPTAAVAFMSPASLSAGH